MTDHQTPKRWTRFVAATTLAAAPLVNAIAQEPVTQTAPDNGAVVAEKPQDAPLPPVAHVNLPVKARIVLIGGGISGNNITETANNNDLLAEQVDPDSYDPTGMYREMVKRFKLAGDEPITVITSASRQFNEIGGRNAEILFGLLGVKNVHVITTHDRDKVDTPENLRALRESRFVFVDGGDQKWLKGIFRETKAEEILLDRCREDEKFIYAGTSAGAMIPSLRMPFKQNDESPDVTEDGIGILPFSVDTHFHRRGRNERLQKMLSEDPENSVAIGLGEGTAVDIHRGDVTIFSADTENDKAKNIVVLTKHKRDDAPEEIRARQYECKDGVCILRDPRRGRGPEAKDKPMQR